ncbi:MAG: hypothetical protein IPO35_11395 [Uliginosibacterium sp.]|jgi:hypothetical protein|nr:hypothetical protein [Uliginosibacterium sp.]MBK9392730.1 hypothetical protein [Uliginosibacterium sp.]MBK9616071.1 hypothetical protein [Uliginosibacterium sp.]
MLIVMEDDPQVDLVVGACLVGLGLLCLLSHFGLVNLAWFDPGFILPVVRCLV